MSERMAATVTAINPRRGRIAVEMQTGEHAVAEIIAGGQVALGDAIEGTFPPRGRAYWRTSDSGTSLQVYVWAAPLTPAGVRALLAD